MFTSVDTNQFALASHLNTTQLDEVVTFVNAYIDAHHSALWTQNKADRIMHVTLRTFVQNPKKFYNLLQSWIPTTGINGRSESSL